MKKICFFAAILTMATVVFSSCSSNNPEDTVTDFFESTLEGDYENAFNLCLFENESKRDSLISDFNQAVKEDLFEKEQMKENSADAEIKVISVEEDGDSAVVELSLSDKKASKRYKDEKFEIEAFLKKMEGKWLIEKIKMKNGGKEEKAYVLAKDWFNAHTKVKVNENFKLSLEDNKESQGHTTTPSESPSKVVEKAINYIYEGDVDEYINIQYYDGDESQIKAGRQQALTSIQKKYGSKEQCKKDMQMNAGNFGEFKIFSEKISEDGKSAVVRYKLFGMCDAIDDSQEGAETIQLRIDATGAWRIVGIDKLQKSMENC